MSLRLVAATLVAAAATITSASCLMCNEVGCLGGLGWEARPFEGGAVRAGDYSLAIDLDGSSYEFDCTVSERARNSVCVGPHADDDRFEVFVEFIPQHEGEQWDDDAPVGSIVVEASALEGDSTRGPRDVHIVLARDDVTLLDASYDITYERDEDFFGDERCGFCDLQQKRSTTWGEE
jgi:hypothetical protein